jgi:TonB family protein
VAYVIEADGSIRHTVVLESSGFKQLDEAAVEIWRNSKYGVPGKLDGQPVRILSYAKVGFTINPKL